MSQRTRLVLAADMPTSMAAAALHDAEHVLKRPALRMEVHVESTVSPLGEHDALVCLSLGEQDRAAIAFVRDVATQGVDEPYPDGTRLANAQECREHLVGYIEQAREEAGLE